MVRYKQHLFMYGGLDASSIHGPGVMAAVASWHN